MLYKNHLGTLFQEDCIEKTRNIPGLKQCNAGMLKSFHMKFLH